MSLVRIGTGNLENLEVWVDTDMDVVPRKGEAILFRGDDRHVHAHLFTEVGYFFDPSFPACR